MAAYLLLSLPLFQLSHALSVQQNSLATIIPTNSLLGRAPPVLPSGWTYKSCVREPSSGRTLTGYSFTSSSMTVDLCVSACATRGYSLAGAEYANECYCGNSFAGAATGGGSVPPESECNMACAGDASQTCGAGNRLSVYANSQITPGAPALPPGWSSTSKCITEASTGRALTGNSFTSQGLTLDQCVDVCDQTGFQYAGAEYGAECYCSNSVSTANGGGVEVAASECNMNCAGNPQQKCGAGYRITLFSKTPSTDPIPTGWTKNFCTVDQSARVLDEYSFTDGSSMSPATCIAACAQRNFVLAGVENGNECYCGNTIKQAYPTKDSDCRVPCSGDDAQFCGGGWRLMVYIKAPGTPTGSNAWTLVPGGNSGVVMTHVAVTTSDTMLVIDRKEDNPLLKADGKPAWGAVWNLQSNTARPLNIATHSFCSSGNFLSNGTLANFGGHPYTDRNGEAVSDGQQGIRLFNPCSASGNCDIYENPTRIRLTSDRWYPSSARLHDGSVIILGGQITAGWTNSESVNNPTYEFFPAKNINGYNGLQIPSQFFKDTLPHNTFPHVFALPSKKIFVAANNQAMLLDWENNIETRLPNFPNGQRVVYPMNAAGVLLPLTPANNYTPEILICGGSHLSDELNGEEIDAQHDYASAQCSRMVLDAAGIAAGWKVEYMPEPRIMSEGVLLPNGKVVIINGGRTGTAGYANSQYRIGDSNADNPTFTPLLYDPSLPAGQRFTHANMPTSNIGRLYHSVATLLPSGAILIGGSNPNDDMETRPWPSEYRVEYLNPSYMFAERPTYTGLPAVVNYGATFTLSVSVPSSTATVKVVLMDLGFITHSVHMDQKAVELVSTLSADRKTLTVIGPPNAPVYSPGPGWIFVVVGDTPSVAQKLIIGTGASPPKDDAATSNMLANTANPISGPHRRRHTRRRRHML
ncbi:Copper radical oxidase, partial [Rhizoctonia solani]